MKLTELFEAKTEKTPEQKKRERQKRADREHEAFMRRKNFSRRVDDLKAQARENDPYKDIGNIVLGNELMTAETRKAKRDAEERFKANVEHVKTSGFNQSYAKKHNLDEGKFIIKSADGVAKSFKDGNSPEAKAWAKTNSKPAAYGLAYWKKKDDNGDIFTIVPWSRIRPEETDAILDAAMKNGSAEVTDAHIGKPYQSKVGEVPVAGMTVRLMLRQEDAEGKDVEETETIGMVRDVKNPKKFVFDGHK